MKRRACSLAVAAAIGLLTLSLLGGAAAGDSGGSSGAPPSLTHHFPLGTQTLSPAKTAPARGAATTPGAAPSTTPSGSPATTPQRNSATPPRGAPATTLHRHGATPATGKRTHGGILGVALLAVIPALIVLALLGRVLVRRSRRTGSRDHAGDGDRALVPAPDGATGGARWGFVDKEDVEPPSLPVREPASLPVLQRAKSDQTPRASPVRPGAKPDETPGVS
jgi:hypothetical protein